MRAGRPQSEANFKKGEIMDKEKQNYFTGEEAPRPNMVQGLVWLA